MNYATIKENDIANGEGVCVSLFVSGCPHHCKGCFNSETWDFFYGKPFTQETMNYILDCIEKNDISRNFSILGGEPLAPQNRETVLNIVRQVRRKFPNIIIYLWTGYVFENLIFESDKDSVLAGILDNVNVLIDGPFIEEKKDLRLKMRGSRNQRIFYLNVFLNAETKHDRSTEQEIVHESDLTGNYKTTFNLDKQQETEMRVKHQ